ncbi:MAG: T9SS type A sorting domain-containing protein [Bacteroidota bacterium]
MRNLLLIIALLFSFTAVMAQPAYVDQFDDDATTFTGGAATFTSSEADGEWTIMGSMTGAYDVVTYDLNDGMGSITVDATMNNKVYVRAKASNVGTQLRMDIEDAGGFATTNAGLQKTLTTDYQVLEYDFTDVYQDGGYGGTSCSAGPCPVDGSMSNQLVFYVNAGIGDFNGSVVIDYISFGEPAEEVIVSDIFQDHFEDPLSNNSIANVPAGYTSNINDSEWTLTGDGTGGEYDPFTYIFVNFATGDTIGLDATANNKIYIKAKTTVPNTSLRVDIQDIDGYVTTAGSITKILTEEYQVFEYNFTGVYSDLGYGGTPCTPETAPCPVDGTRVADLLLFINPGAGMLLGDIVIDYISFGNPLEPEGPPAELIYGDHFGNETVEFTGDPDGGGLVSTEAGSDWTITGNGTAGQYAAVSYLLHDKETGEEIAVDMTPAQNKVYLRAKASAANTPIRLDLLDTANYTTSLTAMTRTIDENYTLLEFDFSGVANDGGYGGTPCTEETAPCPVDLTAIKQILVYPDPVVGMYTGVVDIDFFSIGQPLGVDLGPTGVINYADQMDVNTSFFVEDMTGLTSSFADDVWTITGDGSAGAYSPVVYTTHDVMGEEVLADAVGSNDILFVRAKASAETELRIDVQDNMTFVGNLSPPANMIGTEWAVYEFNYANAYQDGGYGGSPCTSETAPCPVDGQRIQTLQFFMNAAEGGFNGTLEIDWISFGQEIVGVQNPEHLNQFSAFPNPVRDQLNLSYDLRQAATVELALFNALGQRVQLQTIGQQSGGVHSTQVDLSRLSTGLYTLQIWTNGQAAGSLRVVKQ